MFDNLLDLDSINSAIETIEEVEKNHGKDITFQGTRSELRAYINENFGFTFNETITYNPQKRGSYQPENELELAFKMCSNEVLYEYLQKKFKEKLKSDFAWYHPVYGRNEKGERITLGHREIVVPYIPVRGHN